MMEGIEVLSVGSIGVNQVFNWNAAIAGGIILGILCGLYIFLNTDNFLLGYITFIITCFLIGFMLGICIEKYADTVPTYKVIVNDTVSINDFYERYEVLEQDGKIFIIKEKTEDANNNLSTS